MANIRYYGVNVGAMLPTDVTEATATTGLNVELQVNIDKLDPLLARLSVLQALEAIRNYVNVTEGDPLA